MENLEDFQKKEQQSKGSGQRALEALEEEKGVAIARFKELLDKQQKQELTELEQEELVNLSRGLQRNTGAGTQ